MNFRLLVGVFGAAATTVVVTVVTTGLVACVTWGWTAVLEVPCTADAEGMAA